MQAATILPELRELDAGGATASIYAEIRACSALPQVNLIYRHLATLPGALPAVWAAIRPWIGSGAADDAVARILAASPTLDRFSDAELAGADRLAVLDLLGVYGRGNALNLLALSSVRRRLENPQLAPGPSPRPRGVTLPIASIPPLPRLDGLVPRMAQLVSGLAGLHEAARHGVVPSLYLHLANWPGLLPPVQRQVALYVQRGGLAADQASIRAAATAYGIAGAPGPLAPMQAAIQAQVLSALGLFTESVIPDLIAVGRMLASLVGHGAVQDGPA